MAACRLRSRRWKRAFEGLTACVVSLTVFAQSMAFAHQAPATASKLNIVIVEGDGAVNNLRQRVAREPIVQVEDENRKPVAGAVVVFLLPEQGASGSFVNGARTLTAITDNNGRAVARGFQANNSSGQYQMRVTASAQGQMASASIAMSNAALAAGAAAGIGTAKWLLILGAIGGAAAGAGVALSGGGNGGGQAGSPPRGAVITPGTPSVGAP